MVTFYFRVPLRQVRLDRKWLERGTKQFAVAYIIPSSFMDAYVVGSLDFNFLGNSGYSVGHTRVKLFAEGSTATK